MISFPNAKINIGLYVTEKRPDGFHNLETVFYPVGWCDVLEFVGSHEMRFTTSGIPIGGAPENNLVMKAYRLLQNDFKLPPLHIHLHKQIPFGAGLGGGSSDGAFMLKMLNKTFELQLSDEKLMKYAAVLGSDCAFFILNKPVFATGRGEVMNIIDLNLNNWYVLLVKPPVEVSTAKAFQFIRPEKSPVFLPDALQRPVEEWKNTIANQFESSVFQQYSQIEELRDQLYRLGAEYAAMSGSGSCVFGFFKQLPEHINELFPLPFLTFIKRLEIL